MTPHTRKILYKQNPLSPDTPTNNISRVNHETHNNSIVTCIVTWNSMGNKAVLQNIQSNCSRTAPDQLQGSNTSPSTLQSQSDNSNILPSLQPEDSQQALHTSMAEDMKAELEKQKAKTMSLQLQVEQAKIANKLEKEKQQQESWQAALEKLEQARTEQQREHTERLANLTAVDTSTGSLHNPQLGWIQKKLAELQGETTISVTPNNSGEEDSKTKQTLEEIIQKQKKLAQQATALVQEKGTTSPDILALLSAINTPQQKPDQPEKEDQVKLMEQL